MAIAVPDNLKRDELSFMAKLAEQAHRYDEMVEFVDELVIISTLAGSDLTVEERKLLSAAYRHAIGPLQDALRNLKLLEQKTTTTTTKDNVALVDDYKFKIESELSNICSNVLELLDLYLIPLASSSESKAFYLKMKGDYYRYLAEFKIREERESAVDVEEIVAAYRAAEEITRADLAPMHPTRLGLALNFSVFYYEILGDSDRALSLAREAFEEAAANLAASGLKCCADSKLVMQLLKDNFDLWTMNMEVIRIIIN